MSNFTEFEWALQFHFYMIILYLRCLIMFTWCFVAIINSFWPFQPVLEAYRNKDDFSIGLGLDGEEKTVGFYLDPATGKSRSLHTYVVSKNIAKIASYFSYFILYFFFPYEVILATTKRRTFYVVHLTPKKGFISLYSLAGFGLKSLVNFYLMFFFNHLSSFPFFTCYFMLLEFSTPFCVSPTELPIFKESHKRFAEVRSWLSVSHQYITLLALCCKDYQQNNVLFVFFTLFLLTYTWNCLGWWKKKVIKILWKLVK